MIVLVGGEKGGTGKTTIATNLAALRAMAGRDVLLVDTDPKVARAIGQLPVTRTPSNPRGLHSEVWQRFASGSQGSR